MKGSLREVIGNLTTVILNRPPAIFLSFYIFGNSFLKHFQ